MSAPNECVFDGTDYRYVLRRKLEWSSPKHSGACLWIMLNPSTADERQLDPTLKRCWRFTHEWGFSEMVVCNLFAFRTPYPKEMQEAKDPIGPKNDEWIKRCAASASKIIVAWGTGGHFMERASIVELMIQREGRDLHCLGRTKLGDPIHPLARGKHRVPDTAVPLFYA